jgi:hypothetical protein
MLVRCTVMISRRPDAHAEPELSPVPLERARLQVLYAAVRSVAQGAQAGANRRPADDVRPEAGPADAASGDESALGGTPRREGST